MERQDPPIGTTGTRDNYTAEAKELEANAGTWFVLKSWKKPTKKDKGSASALAGNINRGRLAAFRPAGAFEAVSRAHPDGTTKVHVRYTAPTPPGDE